MLSEALRRADVGNASAWDLCLSLEDGQGRGMCKLAAAHLQADRGAACGSIRREHWRNECWFEFGEDLAADGRWDEAIAACREADEYTRHCARHIWSTALLAGRGDEGVRARLTAAFPEHDGEIAAAETDYRTLAARMAAEGGTAADGRAPVSDEELAWQRTFRGAPRIETGRCAGAEPCLDAARGVYTERWRRFGERNPEVLADFCAGLVLPARLDPGEDPVLRAVAARLRAETCEHMTR